MALLPQRPRLTRRESARAPGGALEPVRETRALEQAGRAQPGQQVSILASRLSEVSGLVLGEPQDVLASERYLLYAAVSRPEELLILSWHVADDEGAATPRSLFVDDICDVFGESLSDGRKRRPLGAVDDVPAERRRRLADPAAVGEPLREPRLLAQLREQVWSASSLERWIACPTAWFVERLLRPGAFEADPEPLARGGLAHAALKDTLEGLRRATGSARLSLASLELACELLARALADNEAEHPLSVAPERRTAVRRRLQAERARRSDRASSSDRDRRTAPERWRS